MGMGKINGKYKIKNFDNTDLRNFNNFYNDIIIVYLG